MEPPLKLAVNFSGLAADRHFFIGTYIGLWLFENVLKLLQLGDYAPKLGLLLFI